MAKGRQPGPKLGDEPLRVATRVPGGSGRQPLHNGEKVLHTMAQFPGNGIACLLGPDPFGHVLHQRAD